MSTLESVAATASKHKAREIKCLVWDLDHTLWDGILLEQDDVRLRPGVREVLELLDERGILHSIASRNEPQHALERLRRLGVAEYFLYPQIGWSAKSESMRHIAQSINIGLDTLAFVDDQAFERDEVRFSCPEVLCLDAAEVHAIPHLPEMNPRFVTEDSRRRRQMYLADLERKTVEESFEGPQEEFLASLEMVFEIHAARQEDLKRAEELTVRTNQLNTTGYTYTYDELDALRRSPDHLLLVAGLDDRYGTYGKIGLALVEKKPGLWTIRLLLMSCRVMSRGVGSILINYVRRLARQAGARLQAEMITTERNRMMYMTYRFLNFKEVSAQDRHLVLECPGDALPAFPPYVKLVLDQAV